MELIKTYPQGNISERWGSGYIKMVYTHKLCSYKKDVWNEHGCKTIKIKPLGCRTTNHVKIKNPWQNPTMPVL